MKAASALRHASEVDREGITISAPARANCELFLKGMLQHAKLRPVASANAAPELLVSGEVDAPASLKESRLGLAERMPDMRLPEGRFMGVQQSIAVPKGREAGLTFLKDVVEKAKASGMVGRALERLGARECPRPRRPADTGLDDQAVDLAGELDGAGRCSALPGEFQSRR